MALVLGIETSCDETGVGIVRGNQLLANIISSSMDKHAIFGGVVPEIAARAHLEALTPVLDEALEKANLTLDEIDAIAVTNGPGLAGALMVGVGAAKALAVATGKPIYAVNHLVGHVGADILDRFLEHARVFYFHQGGDPGIFIASADWMGRNLTRRVETLVEINNDTVKAQIVSQIMAANLADEAQSWVLQPDGSYLRELASGDGKLLAEVHNWEALYPLLRDRFTAKAD